MNQISPARASAAAAPAARKRLADRDAKLVRNCWHVAAWSDEVGRRPLARTMGKAAAR